MARRDEHSAARGIASLRRALDTPASRRRPERPPPLDRLQHPHRHPTHPSQLRKGRGATVTFVQLHGTGTQQVVRIIPQVDDRYMTDRALLELYASPG